MLFGKLTINSRTRTLKSKRPNNFFSPFSFGVKVSKTMDKKNLIKSKILMDPNYEIVSGCRIDVIIRRKKWV